MEEITVNHIYQEIMVMRRENREDFRCIREDLKGLVSKTDCANCKKQWVDKRYFLGWGACFFVAIAVMGLVVKFV